MEPAPSDVHESLGNLDTAECGKRHRSVQSTQSSGSGSSSLLRPPAKRGRHEYQLGSTIWTSSSAESSGDSGVDNGGFPPSQASERIRNQSTQVDPMEISHSEPPLRPDRGALDGRSSFLCETDLEVSSEALGHFEDGEDEDQRPEFPSRWDSVEEISKAVRAITAQRPVSTYTSQDLGHIQLAAEYFEAMGYEEDAFPLYALLLKKLHEDCPRDEARFLHAIINYSRCVSTPGHCEIIQHHLQDQAQQLSEEFSSCLLYQFLIEMALAETYSRKYDTAAVKTHLRKARQLIPVPVDNGLYQVSKLLPEDNRSLDLILYHSVRRACDPYAENLLPAEDPKEFHSWELKLRALERTTLHRVPGPFELKDSVMGNPCIRSCLQWCHRNLQHLTYVPGPWMEIVSSEKKVLKESISTTHRMFLFTCLWNIWMNESRASSLNRDADVWMSQAHSRLGVNATELLMITCAQIIHESGPSKIYHNELFLIAGLRQGAARLLENPDDALARCFLNAFVEYRTLEEEESQWLKDLRQKSRAGTMGQLERALQTTFLQTRSFTTELTRSTRRLSMQVAEATKHMTMTSSLRSSNSSLLNFRKVKEAMEERVRNLKEKPSMSSVSFGDGSLRSRWSVWTVSQLSETMGRTSLSLRSTGSAA